MKPTLRSLAIATLVVTLASPIADAAEPSVDLPLERQTYVIGERLPVGVSGDAKVTLTLTPDNAGIARPVRVYAGPAGPLTLDTRTIAPGRYTLTVNGYPTEHVIELISPLRDSPGAIVSEVGMPGAFGDKTIDVEAAKRVGLDAYFAMGAQRDAERQNPNIDKLLKAQTLSWINPYNRVKSFRPALTWDYELEHMAQRLALGAQANLRYPGFAGWCFEWDPAGFDRQPSIFFRFGKHQEAHDAYLAASREALRREFKQTTGHDAPTTEEYLRYVIAIGRPQWAPVIDLPSYKWAMRVAEHLPKPSDAEVVQLEQRTEAWHRFLMGIYERTHRRYQQSLDAIDPAMAHTGSVNLDHAKTSEGQYAPSAYQHMELREMSAWNDQIGHGDYAFQWLLSGALMDTRNPNDQPVWVAGYMGTAHVDYPGKLPRVIAHNLSHNGTGAGTAAENVLHIFGNYAKDHPKHQPEIDAARDLLNRFVALAVNGRSGGKVAVLYSKTQFSRERYQEMFGTRAWQAIVTLTRLGYTPRFITEEEIAAGGLDGYAALTIWEQTFDLPADVTAKIGSWAKAGGRIIADADTTFDLPGMTKMSAGVMAFDSRRVYGWTTPNADGYPGHMPQMARLVHTHLADAVRDTLGTTGLAAMHSTNAPAETNASVTQIDGGDATYLVVVNDSTMKSHMQWHEVRETLTPTAGTVAGTPGAQLYDVSEEKHLGDVAPVECDLTRTTARVYAILPRAIGDVDLRATQRVTAGGTLYLDARARDADGGTLAAVVPVHVSISRPDGSLAFAGYRGTDRTGRLAFEFTVPINAPEGTWTVAVRSQLDGRRVSVPVTVAAGADAATRVAARTAEPVVVRQRAAIVKLLSEGGEIVAPVFADGSHRDLHRKLADRVRKAVGERATVRVVDNPEMTTYTLAYVVSDAEKAVNARVDAGEAFGKIERRTNRGNDYFTDMGGYRFGRHVVLFDLVGVAGDNPLAERLAEQGMLWPRVGAAYPGDGRAVVQLVHDAFDLEKDAIVVQATDADGLLAGATALADLPADWVGTSVSDARAVMLRQLNVHGGAKSPTLPGGATLSARGRRVDDAATPYRMDFSHGTPPAADAFHERERRAWPVVTIPITLDGIDPVRKNTVALQRGRGDNKWVKSASSHGTGNPDLRFNEAHMLVIDVDEKTDATISVSGTFRYSDRIPRTQGNWQEILRLYERHVPAKREPMRWVVQVNGETVGALTPTATANKDVPIDTLPFYIRTPPPSVNEEVVSELSGTFTLPKGRHEIRLIYENMIDGELTGVSVVEAK